MEFTKELVIDSEQIENFQNLIRNSRVWRGVHLDALEAHEKNNVHTLT